VNELERLALAHALRTPLTSALLAAGALTELGPLNGAQFEAIRTLLEDLRRLQVLCEGALDVSRSGAYAGPLERRPVDARELIARAAEPLRQQAGARGVTVTVSARRTATVVVDRLKIAWALAALLGNAIRYAQSNVDVQLRVRKDRITIAIADDGPGIAPDRIGRLFERDGTALGLYLVREIVEAHGGRIEVRSKSGTCFLVTLPHVENEP